MWLINATVVVFLICVALRREPFQSIDMAKMGEVKSNSRMINGYFRLLSVCKRL
jgi:hypothetical protein